MHPFRERSHSVLTAIRSREERADYGNGRATHDAHLDRVGEGRLSLPYERTLCHAGTYSYSHSHSRGADSLNFAYHMITCYIHDDYNYLFTTPSVLTHYSELFSSYLILLHLSSMNPSHPLSTPL